jgi:hypothetical protein
MQIHNLEEQVMEKLQSLPAEGPGSAKESSDRAVFDP